MAAFAALSLLALAVRPSEARAQCLDGHCVCPLKSIAVIRPPDADAAEGGGFTARRGANRRHGALDLNAAEGDTVLAARAGTVALAGPFGLMGIAVIIDHGDGEYTVYGHLQRVLATAGTRATAGARIGLVGHTGNAAHLRELGLPPHLQFAVIRAGRTGLAAVDSPLTRMRDMADSWQDIAGPDLIIGVIHPNLILGGRNCWSGNDS